MSPSACCFARPATFGHESIPHGRTRLETLRALTLLILLLLATSPLRVPAVNAQDGAAAAGTRETRPAGLQPVDTPGARRSEMEGSRRRAGQSAGWCSNPDGSTGAGRQCLPHQAGEALRLVNGEVPELSTTCGDPQARSGVAGERSLAMVVLAAAGGGRLSARGGRRLAVSFAS